MAFDHLVWVVPDLDEGIASFYNLAGVRVQPSGIHPARGTKNAVVGFANGGYLEIIAPDTAQDEPVKGRSFGAYPDVGPHLASWAASTTRLDLSRSRMLEAGYDPGAIMERNRMMPDGSELRWQMTPIPEMPFRPTFPFVLEWQSDPASVADTHDGLQMRHLELRHPEARQLQSVLDTLDASTHVITVTEGLPAIYATLLTPNGEILLRGKTS